MHAMSINFSASPSADREHYVLCATDKKCSTSVHASTTCCLCSPTDECRRFALHTSISLHNQCNVIDDVLRTTNTNTINTFTHSTDSHDRYMWMLYVYVVNDCLLQIINTIMTAMSPAYEKKRANVAKRTNWPRHHTCLTHRECVQ